MARELDVDEIRKLLPHRYPMLLLDRVLDIDPGVRVVGLKNVTINEPFFNGHFPGTPVMPGVLIIEAMAQAAGVLILAQEDAGPQLTYLAEVERIRFRRPVVPGDALITEASTVWLRGTHGKVRVLARVDGNIVAEGELKFTLKPLNERAHRVQVPVNNGDTHQARESAPLADQERRERSSRRGDDDRV